MAGGKKAQLTIFIILGIALLIGALIFWYVQSRKAEITEIPVIAEVPEVLDPVYSYIKNCLSLVTQQAISAVAGQGGYADPLASGFQTNDISPTEASAVRFTFGSDIIIPYWIHAEGSNANNCQDCVFQNHRPFLYATRGTPSLQDEIKKYIEQNIDICLANFQEIKNQGYAIERSENPLAEITITDTQVIAKLTYPFRILRNGQSFQLSEFLTTENVRLKELYELASKIMEMQVNYSYFERQFRELVAIYSGKDPEALPPPSDSDSKFVGERWVKTVVQRRLQTILQQYIPLTQVYGTKNYEPYFTSTDIGNEIMNSITLIPIEEDHTKIKVHFNYLDFWPMYFDLNCDGEICQAQSFRQNFLAMFGFQQYNFAYDASYPILVELTDQEAFNGKGVSFKYFIEANIRNNEPFTPGTLPLPNPEFLGANPSTMCDRDSFTSGPVTITVTSRGQPVENALVSFQCVMTSCSIGTTDNQGKIISNLPRCLGGNLKAQFSNQFGFSLPKTLNTFTDHALQINLKIEPHRAYEVSVQRFLLKKSGKFAPWILEQTPHGLETDEVSFIALLRKSEPDEEPFSATAMIMANETFADFRLVPGVYDVKIMNILQSPAIVIPEDNRTIEQGFFSGIMTGLADIFTEQDLDSISLPEIVLNQTMIGGAEFTWGVSADQLDQGSKITFTTADADLLNTPQELRIMEDLTLLGSVKNISEQYRRLLQPQIR